MREAVKEEDGMEEKIINIEDRQPKELENLKEKYFEVEMPKEQVEKMKIAMEKGKMDRRREQRKIMRTRFVAGAAAVIAALIILPNTSSGVAYAMGKIPVLGDLVKLVTWREYHYEDERHQADIEVAKLDIGSQMSEIKEEEVEACLDYAAETEALKKSAEEINSEIEEITNRLMEEFETNIQEEMGYRDLVVKSQVISQNEKYLTLQLSCFEAAASGYEWNYFYTIDLNTGKRLQLKDLFLEEADYILVISDNIKKQMKEQMENDENVFYWLEEEVEEWNFKTITEDTLFYLNEEEKLVISFNEAEVAPAYMGVIEFVIEEEVLSPILK